MKTLKAIKKPFAATRKPREYIKFQHKYGITADDITLDNLLFLIDKANTEGADGIGLHFKNCHIEPPIDYVGNDVFVALSDMGMRVRIGVVTSKHAYDYKDFYIDIRWRGIDEI